MPALGSLLKCSEVPFVPKLTKFLLCFDLYQSVRITSLVLMALWIIYAIGGFVNLATGLPSVLCPRIFLNIP